MVDKYDDIYLNTILTPIRACESYKPNLGHKKKGGYSLTEFKILYGNDPFYHWLGLDDSLMYSAHRAAGGMTSIYRQIGIGFENLFRLILQNTLGLSEEQTRWSYQVRRPNGKIRTLSLDGRITIDKISDNNSRDNIRSWLNDVTDLLEIDPAVASSIKGVVFEVRQGYKSKDSKRQNADIANASAAYTSAYLPCALILSTQIDEDIYFRYRAEKWMMLTGRTDSTTPLESTYAFMKYVIGYDLASFLQRNSVTLRAEIGQILKTLLKP